MWWAFRSLLKWMVRAVGIEPTLLAERDFESRASTNFTTPALRPLLAKGLPLINYISRSAFSRVCTKYILAGGSGQQQHDEQCADTHNKRTAHWLIKAAINSNW